MSINIQSPVSLSTAGIKQMRAVFLLEVPSFMQHPSTPVFFLGALVLSLVIL